MGILPRYGLVFTVSCSYCRRLLTEECKILETLGKAFPFESTIGINGRIWINGHIDNIRMVKTALLRLESVSDEDVVKNFDQLLKELRGEIGPAEEDDDEMNVDQKVEVKNEIKMED